ncbi:hypothetical protein CBL_08190 [Carabus blaptoides fortunei]
MELLKHPYRMDREYPATNERSVSMDLEACQSTSVYSRLCTTPVTVGKTVLHQCRSYHVPPQYLRLWLQSRVKRSVSVKDEKSSCKGTNTSSHDIPSPPTLHSWPRATYNGHKINLFTNTMLRCLPVTLPETLSSSSPFFMPPNTTCIGQEIYSLFVELNSTEEYSETAKNFIVFPEF